MNPFYPLPIPCIYNSNRSYRNILRQISNMDTSIYVDKVNRLPNIDEETLDEYNFDELSISKFLDKIYAHTSSNTDFIHLYELAASKMISTDPHIGITILCSYDYLYLFYPLLCEYTQDKSIDVKENTYYMKIMKKIL